MISDDRQMVILPKALFDSLAVAGFNLRKSVVSGGFENCGDRLSLAALGAHSVRLLKPKQPDNSNPKASQTENTESNFQGGISQPVQTGYHGKEDAQAPAYIEATLKQVAGYGLDMKDVQSVLDELYKLDDAAVAEWVINNREAYARIYGG